ncbi:MAG: tRNA (guanosine(37)-N1)-methyltransferase TrmD [Candidatus Omnitrophica bacterium]|nr:tRNA (guanosine(37)-N1)-methyltransferase TrmD [Candidatus Omnitrophota bacterium]
MRIDILTLFPAMFDSVLGESILKRAQAKKLIEIKIHNLRDWTFDNHRTADDKPFGGGPGMVMKIEPVWLALCQLGVLRKDLGLKRGARRETRARRRRAKTILLTPQGRRLDQKLAKELAREKSLVLICGHYEGVDERIRELVDEEISIGDYILTCGEIPAMVLIDCVVRLLPGVLGDADSLLSESFENGLLEYPQYTRPAEFKGMKVPSVLLSGDHRKIKEWRRAEALKRTIKKRPDLIGKQ